MDDLQYVLDKCEELHSQLVDLNTFVADKDGKIYRSANKRIEKMIIKLWKIKTDFRFEQDPDFFLPK